MSGGVTLVAGVAPVLPWGGAVVSVLSISIPAVAVTRSLSVSHTLAVSFPFAVSVAVAVTVTVSLPVAIFVAIPPTVIVVVRSSGLSVAGSHHFHFDIRCSGHLKRGKKV